MRNAIRALMLVACGCAGRVPYDPATVCRVVADARPMILRGVSARELAELSWGTPVAPQARSARAQGVTVAVLSGVGAAALVGGLIAGFATDPTQSAARTAGYSIVGGAIGLGAISLVLAFTGRRAFEEARVRLLAFGSRCQNQ